MQPLFSSYARKGYIVIPVQPRTKTPSIFNGTWSALPKWQQKDNYPEDIERWSKYPADSGIGLLLNRTIIALDYDECPELHREIRDALPDSLCAKQGEKGQTVFYRARGDEKSQSWSYRGKRVLDLLATGRQTVLPPSIHPCGQSYKWLNGVSLLDIDIDQLPYLPEDYLKRIDAIFARYEPAKINGPLSIAAKNRFTGAKFDELIEAIEFIPADNYDEWLSVGMALKEELGAGGFEIWDKWSQKSALYLKNKPNEMQNKWSGFKRHETKAGSIFYLAQKYGWVKSFCNEAPKIELLDEPNIEDKQQQRRAHIEELCMEGGLNLVGEVRDWLQSSCHDLPPSIALGAALAFVGALKGRKFCTDTNLRSNLFILSVAPSGTGKTRAMCALRLLASEIFPDGGFWLSDPTSDAAVLDALNTSPRRFLEWDECGKKLFVLTQNKNRQTYQENLVTAIMQLFSSAGTVYQNKARAINRQHKGASYEEKQIKDPHLSIFGATTDVRFYEALDRDMVEDGFLARFLVLPTIAPIKTQDLEERKIITPPLELVARCINSFTVFEDGCVAIPWASSKVRQMWSSYRFSCDKKGGAIWSRAGEHVAKLCLTIANDKIDQGVLEWSILFVETLIANLLSAINTNLKPRNFSEQAEKVLGIIRENNGSISQRNVCRALKRPISEIEQTLRFLIAGGYINIVKKHTAGAGRPSIQYELV